MGERVMEPGGTTGMSGKNKKGTWKKMIWILDTNEEKRRELVVRSPATHKEADDLERGDREEVEEPDVEVSQPEPRGKGDGREDQKRREQEDDRREVVHAAIRVGGDDVLFDQELHGISDRLKPAMRATNAVRPDPRLKSRREFPLHPGQIRHDQHQHVQQHKRRHHMPDHLLSVLAACAVVRSEQI